LRVGHRLLRFSKEAHPDSQLWQFCRRYYHNIPTARFGRGLAEFGADAYGKGARRAGYDPRPVWGYRDWREASRGSRIPFATRSARQYGGADDKSSALITVAEFFMDIAELLACLDGNVRVSFFAFIRNVPTDLSTAREFSVVWIVFLITLGFLISHLNSSVTSVLRAGPSQPFALKIYIEPTEGGFSSSVPGCGRQG
jgi:hypothetical protein